MISLVELTITKIEEYLIHSLLSKDEFIHHNLIIKWKTIGTTNNIIYNNEFSQYMRTRIITDEVYRHNFIELLSYDELVELEEFIKVYKSEQICRIVIAFDKLQYMGIVDMIQLLSSGIPLVNVKEFLYYDA